MKKIILLIVFCIYGILPTNAATITIQGQITNSINNIGISNHAVYISDSVNYYDIFTTTANGYYYIVITGVTPAIGLSYYLMTKDCNNIPHYGIAHSTNSSTIVNFSICDTSSVSCQNSFVVSHQNLNYSFSGNNVNTYPTVYSWSFGDGNFANAQNTSHTYQQPVSGFVTYTVTLNTKTFLPNFDTCFSQSQQLINIAGNNPVISGNVTAGGSIPDSGFVFLYGINNPIGSCILIDTVSIDTSGFYYFNNFAVSYPAYILKAKLHDNSTMNSLYIPSYYDSLYSWVNSPPVYPVTNNLQYNIDLIPFVVSVSGIAGISGSVMETSNKNPESIPIPGIEVLLLNTNNKPIRLAYTDNSGNYSFSNLAFDSYKVFVEIAGKMSNPAGLSLDISRPNASNTNFIIKGNIITLAVDDEYDLNNYISEIYPNPGTADVYIDFSLKKSENVRMRICNQLGELLQDYHLKIQAGNQQHHIDTHGLREGFYTVQIINYKYTSVRKFIKME